MKEKLQSDLSKAHAKILEMINSSKGVADKNSLGMFYVIEDVIKRIGSSVDENGTIDPGLYEEFNKVKGISIRAFEGTILDDLIWQINSQLSCR